MDNKEKYNEWNKSVFIPIYSKSWWLDAICGVDNWDVWLYEKGDAILASMPYYKEKRNGYTYITKAPLTQNNGLIIDYPINQKIEGKQAFEERIIDEVCLFIKNLKIDVYEQQFHYSFDNFVPFFWNQYSIIPRITFVIEETEDVETVRGNYTKNKRKKVKKGRENTDSIISINENDFYSEHEKIFIKQGLRCPFSYELWIRLYEANKKNNSGKIMAAVSNGEISSLVYLVEDEKSVYLLLGGAVPSLSSLETYSYLVDKSIEYAGSKKKVFDFEGSVIRRINKSAREFGGTPKTYYRIRKVFNPDIIIKEAQDNVEMLAEN